MVVTHMTELMSSNEQQERVDQYQGYCIVIAGELDQNWSEWLGGMRIIAGHDQNGRSITTLWGEFPDQPALRGILNKIWDLHLTLVSVTRVDISCNEDLKEVNDE